MAKSKYTKTVRYIAALLTLVSFVLCFGPAIWYVGSALLSDAAIVHKVALTFTCTISVIMSLICLIRKTAFKSSIWLMLIGLWLCLDNIMGMIIITAICQTLDELIVAPFAKYMREKAHISSEIDKRVP